MKYNEKEHFEFQRRKEHSIWIERGCFPRSDSVKNHFFLVCSLSRRSKTSAECARITATIENVNKQLWTVYASDVYGKSRSKFLIHILAVYSRTVATNTIVIFVFSRELCVKGNPASNDSIINFKTEVYLEVCLN